MRLPTGRARGVLWCVAALFLASPATGQSDASSIRGVVRDQSGRAVPGAVVRLINDQTGARRTVQTDETGSYFLEGLPPGVYGVMVEARSFETARAEHTKLEIAQIRRFDVTLYLGAATTVIDVSGSVNLLDTESASAATVITKEKLGRLPLNGRQFLQLALLVPSTNPGGRTVQQNSVRQGAIGGLSI